MAEGPLEVLADPLWLRLEWLGYPRGLVDSSMVDVARLDPRLRPFQVEAIGRQAVRLVSHRMREALEAEVTMLQLMAPTAVVLEDPLR